MPFTMRMNKASSSHSESKTDMDLERFPSEKFDANEFGLEHAMPSYNILRMIGVESIDPNHPMKHPVKRHRIGTVIKNLIMMACHITKHARRKKAWDGEKQYMAENVPESMFGVQLSIDHYSVYSSNNT